MCVVDKGRSVLRTAAFGPIGKTESHSPIWAGLAKGIKAFLESLSVY